MEHIKFSVIHPTCAHLQVCFGAYKTECFVNVVFFVACVTFLICTHANKNRVLQMRPLVSDHASFTLGSPFRLILFPSHFLPPFLLSPLYYCQAVKWMLAYFRTLLSDSLSHVQAKSVAQQSATWQPTRHAHKSN